MHAGEEGDFFSLPPSRRPLRCVIAQRTRGERVSYHITSEDMSATEEITATVHQHNKLVYKLSSLITKRNPGNDVAKKYIRCQSSSSVSLVARVKSGKSKSLRCTHAHKRKYDNMF